MSSIYQITLLIMLALISACTTTTEGPKKAEPNLDKAAKTYFDLGIAYIRKERYDLAEPKLKRALSISSTPEIYNALALIYEETHNNLLAEETYEELISRYPDFSLGYENYNIFLCKYDRTDQILSLTQQISKDKPELAHIAAGNCAYQKRNINEAINQYELALNYNNKNEQALLPLSKIYYDLNQHQEAYHFIKITNNFVGYSPESLYLSILITRALGLPSEENKYSEALIRLYPTSKEAQSI